MLSINKQIHKYSWRETPQTKTNKQLDNLQNKKFELKTNSLENHIHTFYLQVDMVQFNWIKYLQKKAVQEWTELVQFTMLSMPCLLSRVQEIQILKKKKQTNSINAGWRQLQGSKAQQLVASEAPARPEGNRH